MSAATPSPQKCPHVQAQQRLSNKRVIFLDLPALLAGTQFRGSFEERLQGVLSEAEASRGRVVLFIDELHTLAGAGQVRLLAFEELRGASCCSLTSCTRSPAPGRCVVPCEGCVHARCDRRQGVRCNGDAASRAAWPARWV